MDQDLVMQSMRHAVGRGISPVPNSGAGLWSDIGGFGKKVYHMAIPHVERAGRDIAKSIVGDLSKRVMQL